METGLDRPDVSVVRYRVILVATLATAFALRALVRAHGGAVRFWDEGYIFYFDLAQSLAAGHGYALEGVRTAFRVPLYPLFLAALTGGAPRFWTLLVAQSLVSAGTVACAVALGRRLVGPVAGLIAGVLTALYPYYIYHDTSLQETGLFTFLTALSMVLLLDARRKAWVAVAAGAVLGLAILTRATVAPFVPVAAVWLFLPVEARDPPVGTRAAHAALFLAATLAVLSPWLVRNHGITGRWALDTDLGRAVFVGNNAQTFSRYPVGSIDRSRDQAIAALPPADRATLRAFGADEVGRSAWFMGRGLAFIRAHPAAFAAGFVRKDIAAFGPVLSPWGGVGKGLLVATTYGPVLVLSLVGLWLGRRRWRVHAIVYAQFAIFAGITGVLWGHTSHRAYLDVYLIVFAASVLARVPWVARSLSGHGRVAATILTGPAVVPAPMS